MNVLNGTELYNLKWLIWCYVNFTLIKKKKRNQPLSSIKAETGFLYNFYWDIVDLQCCVSFRCTAKWISYTYTYIHSFLDSFPIEAITEYWVEFPVLYSRSILVICFIYSSVYMSVLVFQFIPPPLTPPAVTISLFSTSVTLFLFCR